jgi:phosphoglycerate dehydrogenase-like enzyme
MTQRDAGRPGAKIGLSADLFNTHGQPMFGGAPLRLFSEAGLAWDVVATHQGQLSPSAFTDYEALLIGGSRVSGAELAGESGKLRIVARNGVGYDAVDTRALSARGILLTNTPVAVRNAVATTAVAFILALSLRLPLKSRLAREGRWRERPDHPGVGLPGRTLGIVGLGGIGRELARLMQPYGMTILAADPRLDAEAASEAGATLRPLDDLLKLSDFVVVACLLDDTTRRLLNADRLRLMKASAHLINVARGPIIDEPALIEALREGRIAGAALDVFEREPPETSNPLLAMENVISTAHCLCWTDSFVESVATDAISGIIDVLKDRWPSFVVNAEARTHARVRAWLHPE